MDESARKEADARFARRDALTWLALILLGSAALGFVLLRDGPLLLWRAVFFVCVAAFVVWAVITERIAWRADEERIARQRTQRRRRRTGADPDLPPPAASRVLGGVAPGALAIHGTRDRGPQGRPRRLSRHMQLDLPVRAMLVGITVIVLGALAYGCQAMRSLGEREGGGSARAAGAACGSFLRGSTVGWGSRPAWFVNGREGEREHPVPSSGQSRRPTQSPSTPDAGRTARASRTVRAGRSTHSVSCASAADPANGRGRGPPAP